MSNNYNKGLFLLVEASFLFKHKNSSTWWYQISAICLVLNKWFKSFKTPWKMTQQCKKLSPRWVTEMWTEVFSLAALQCMTFFFVFFNGNQEPTCKRKHTFPVGLQCDVDKCVRWTECIALAGRNVTSATVSRLRGKPQPHTHRAGTRCSQGSVKQ